MNVIVFFYFKEQLGALEGNFKDFLVQSVDFEMQELSLRVKVTHEGSAEGTLNLSWLALKSVPYTVWGLGVGRLFGVRLHGVMIWGGRIGCRGVIHV